MTPMDRRPEPQTTSASDPDTQRRSRVERRRQLRRQSTDAELLLWRLLRGRQRGGAKFRRQHQVGPYVLDLYCPEQRVAVEADGAQHLTVEGVARDAVRTRYLESKGIRVLRFTNAQILTETDAVVEAIAQDLEGGPSPSPSPFAKGEGSDTSAKGEGSDTSLATEPGNVRDS